MWITDWAAALSGLSAVTARRYRYVVAGVIALTALMWSLALHSIAGQIGGPFPGFFYTPHGVVSSFTPESFTGWQAGLRPGDVVLAVNGQRWREIPRLVQEDGIGSTLVYTVERGGTLLEFSVPTMEFTSDIPLGILPEYFLLSLVFLTVGVFVYVREPRGLLNGCLLLYLSVWAQGGSIVWETYLSQAKHLAYLLVPYAITAPVIGWIFLWSFPADETRRRFLARWPLIQVFVVLAVVCILAMTGLRVLASSLDQQALWSLLAFLTGWPYFITFGLGSIPLKAGPLMAIALRPGNRSIRQQALVMIGGLVLGLSGWYLCLWAPAAIHVPPIISARWGGIIPILYPLSIGYAIFRYQLLNIKVVVRKGLIYSLLTATLTALFLLLSLLSGYLFQNLTGRQSPLVVLFPALLVAFLFQPVRSYIQAFVDRAFFRREYEVRQTLTEFSHRLSVLREREELARLVLTTVSRTLGANEARLWVLQDGHYATAGTASGGEHDLLVDGSLVGWLARERRTYLPSQDDHSAAAEELRRAGAVLAVPLVSAERMVGILTLAGKRSGDLYSAEDLDLLGTLAPSTALALENARLHEERLAILRQQFSQATTIQEEERRRIARELHDGLGPSLASLAIRLHTIRRGLERERNPVAAEVEELAEQVRADIRDVRRLIEDLRPAVLDQLGLAPALREYMARYERDQGIRVSLVASDGEAHLPTPLETALFRIAQEALANVAKHAQASSVEVRLVREAKRVGLVVADDGRGFEPETPVSGAHLGLWSMRRRVEQLGGELTISSSPGEGTRLAVSVPLKD